MAAGSNSVTAPNFVGENIEDDDIRFVFFLIDYVNNHVDRHSSEGNGLFDYKYVEKLLHLVEDYLIKYPQFSNHGQRIVHFILYLNTELEYCSWIKTDISLNLSQYVHSKPITKYVYYKLVEVLNLKPYMLETITCTPYSFCRDIVGIILPKIKAMDGFKQLKETEHLIIALIKSIKCAPVNSTLEKPLIVQFNQAMMVFNVDNFPDDIKILRDVFDARKDFIRFKGYKVKSIFKILNEIIVFISITDTYGEYALYRLKSIRQHGIGNLMFNKLLNIVLNKCVDMCDFSFDTWKDWISFYQVEVIEEDTNLQASIGRLCYDLCSFIDNGYGNGTNIKKHRYVLENMAVKKVDFTNVNIDDIIEMIFNLENCSEFNINDWIKKMVENPEVFNSFHAIEAFCQNIDNIDFNCFKCLFKHCIAYYKSGGIIHDSMCNILYKGIKRLDMVDKINFFNLISNNYANNTFHFTQNFDEELKYIIENESNPELDQTDLISKTIWLILQQPRKALHLLIKQYITGIYGLPSKLYMGIDRAGWLYALLVNMHEWMADRYIYFEYSSWLEFKSELGLDEMNKLSAWIVQSTKETSLIEPTCFLLNVIVPLLTPSPNYEHMLFLVEITALILAECPLVTPSVKYVWKSLVIQFAKILDDARWSMDNYAYVRVQLCEKIIVTIQPLLQYASYIVKPKDLDYIKQKLSNLHLMTRSHFLRISPTGDYITIDGMDEQFIMTVQSPSQISYSNLNRSSINRQHFISSIAKYMPKLTVHEMRSFLANYFYLTKMPNILEASYFLLDCIIDAIGMIIAIELDMKNDVQTDPAIRERYLKYVVNGITFFFDVVNVSKMACIYDRKVDEKVAFNSLTKIIKVLKQLDNASQLPLLCIMHRITSVIIIKLDKESISKLLTLIASIKTKNSKDMLKDTVEELIKQLRTNPTNQI